MTKTAGMMLLLISVAGLAVAAEVPSAPEINLTSGAGAFALLSGALLLIRGRRKK